jgi:heme exporter protein B
MISFSLSGETPGNDMIAGIIWIVIFFGAMSGLHKSFVSEEERGTSLLLKLNASPSAVYFGKLLYNIILNTLISLCGLFLIVMFIGNINAGSIAPLIVTTFLGSLGIASASTIISAIISRASVKGSLFPVLSFPLLLPLILTGISCTKSSLDMAPFSNLISDLTVMVSYSIVVVSVSSLLFDFVWKD